MSVTNTTLFRILVCISTSIVYNLLRKGLSKELSPKIMTIFLYGSAFITALVIGGVEGKGIISGLEIKHALLLLITGITIYFFQYSSAMAGKLGYNMASFRMITSISYIVILLFLESYFYGDKITLNKIIGLFFGALALYFLIKQDSTS